jgi:hypothetical protein
MAVHTKQYSNSNRQGTFQPFAVRKKNVLLITGQAKSDERVLLPSPTPRRKTHETHDCGEVRGGGIQHSSRYGTKFRHGQTRPVLAMAAWPLGTPAHHSQVDCGEQKNPRTPLPCPGGTSWRGAAAGGSRLVCSWRGAAPAGLSPSCRLVRTCRGWRGGGRPGKDKRGGCCMQEESPALACPFASVEGEERPNGPNP